MFERDLFVALVALVLGLVMVFSAILNLRRTFEMRTPRYLIEQFGPGTARMIIGVIGTIIVLMGLYILFDSAAIRHKFERTWTSSRALQLNS